MSVLFDCKTLFCYIFLLLLFINSIQCNTYEYWVDSTIGNDINDGTLENPFKTLERALIPFKTPDTSPWVSIHLSPGIYTSHSMNYIRGSNLSISRCERCPFNELGNELTTSENPIIQVYWEENTMLNRISFTAHHIVLSNLIIEPLEVHAKFASVVKIEDGFATLTNVIFRNFQPRSSGEYYLSSIISSGGNSSILLSGSHFENNHFATSPTRSESHGLAIHVTQLSKLTVVHSSFINNSINAIKITGGLISACTANISDSIFVDNSAIGRDLVTGAVIGSSYTGSKCFLYVYDSLFENNRATMSNEGTQTGDFSGGAISVSNANAYISNVTFINNYAPKGGAISSIIMILMNQKQYLEIFNCRFINNSAKDNAAAIYISHTYQSYYMDDMTASFVITNSSFIQNGFTKESNMIDHVYTDDDTRSASLIFIQSKSNAHSVFMKNIFITASTKNGRLPASRIVVLGSSILDLEAIRYEAAEVVLGVGSLINVQRVPVVFIANIRTDDMQRSFYGSIAGSDETLSLFFIDGEDDKSTVEKSSSLIKSLYIDELGTPCAVLNVQNMDTVLIEEVSIIGYQTRPLGTSIFLHSLVSLDVNNVVIDRGESQMVILDVQEVVVSELHLDRVEGIGIPTFVTSNAELLKLRFSSFTNNYRRQAVKLSKIEKLIIENCDFINNRSPTDDTAGLYIDYISPISVEISNCVFKNNFATNGAAINIWNSANINNCTFENNVASYLGGAISGKSRLTISHSVLIGNQAPTAGAVFLSNPDYLFTDSLFQQNQAFNGAGGAFYLITYDRETGPIPLINRCNFTDNYARVRGGALALLDHGKVHTILGSKFTRNCVGPRDVKQLLPETQPLFGQGGAIFADASIRVDSCLFTKNEANAGGGIHLSYGSKAYRSLIADSEFKSNTAQHSGGAITFSVLPQLASIIRNQSSLVEKGLVVIPNNWLSLNIFQNNTAVYSGGALAFSGLGLNLTCGGNVFIGNSAWHGGAIFYDRSVDAVQNIATQVMAWNSAVGGGALFYSELRNPSLDEVVERRYKRANQLFQNNATGWGETLASQAFDLQWIESVIFEPKSAYPSWPIPSVPFYIEPPKAPSLVPNTSNACNVRSIQDVTLDDKMFDLQIPFEDQERSLPKFFLNEPSQWLVTKKRSPTVSQTVFDYKPTDPNLLGPVPAHSGITKILSLRAVDQFHQLINDSQSYPYRLSFVKCPTQVQCDGVTLIKVGTSPTLSSGSVHLEINLVLSAAHKPFPHKPVSVDLLFSFDYSSSVTSPDWLNNTQLLINVVLEGCPVGYGFTGPNSYSCQPCPFTTYSLNNAGICKSCTDTPNLSCSSRNVVTDRNFWINFDQKSNYAVAHRCPIGYCTGTMDNLSKSKIRRADGEYMYNQPDERVTQCIPSRTGVLCGDCLPGLNESISSACIKCDKPNWPLLVFAFFGLWVAVIVLHAMVSASSGKSTILFYFVQTALLISSDISIEQAFNWTSSNDSFGICLLPLNPIQRKALYALLPIIMAIQMCLTFLLHRILLNFILPFFNSIISSLSRTKNDDNEDDEDDDSKPLIGKGSKRQSIQKNDQIDEKYILLPTSPIERVSIRSSKKNGVDHQIQPVLVSEKPEKFMILGSDDNSNLFVSEEDSLVDTDDAAELSDSDTNSGPDLIVDHQRVVSDKKSSKIRLSDSDSQENDFSNIPEIQVPVFGYELTDDEEEALEEVEISLEEWNIIEPDDVPDQHYHGKKKTPLVLVPNTKYGPLPALASLQRWMVEKKFFHKYRLIRTLLALTTFEYSSLLQFVFAVADCYPIEHGPTVLKFAPSILCSTPYFKWWRFLALMLSPILLIIFFGMLAKLLQGHFKKEHSQADVRFGIWYEMYKPAFFFWKIVELIRRTALIAAFVLLDERSLVSRGITISTICFLILLLQALIWPYRHKLENSLETLSTFSLSIISTAVIWYSVQNGKSRAPSIIIWSLIIATTTIIAVAFAISTLKKRIIPKLKVLSRQKIRRFCRCC